MALEPGGAVEWSDSGVPLSLAHFEALVAGLDHADRYLARVPRVPTDLAQIEHLRAPLQPILHGPIIMECPIKTERW